MANEHITVGNNPYKSEYYQKFSSPLKNKNSMGEEIESKLKVEKSC